MEIWVIGRSYPEPSNNMMGSFEFEQAKMLQKNGEDVHYLCCSLHPTRVIKKWGYQCWKEDVITVHSYSKRFFPRVYPLYLPKFRNSCWKRFFHRVYEETGRPDIIHVHYPAMMMIADVLREFHELGVKIVVTEHWTKVLEKSLDKIEKREYQKYFEYIDICICVSEPLANAVKETIGNVKTHVLVVPNMVDLEFQPIYTKHNEFEFIAVGRLVKVKQFDQVIKGFSTCFRGKPIKLTVVGDGEEYEILKKLIIEHSMEKQITLTGSLPRKQVAQCIANADCLVCYSRFETFGVPIIEAWACGIPTVVASTAAAVIDNFDNRLGIEVSYDNIAELEDAMLYIYENIEQYDKKVISKFAREKFSESVVYKKLAELYQKVGRSE